MVITLSICGLVLLLLLVFAFTDSIIEVAIIILLTLFFTGQCNNSETSDKTDKSITITVKDDTSTNNKLFEIK